MEKIKKESETIRKTHTLDKVVVQAIKYYAVEKNKSESELVNEILRKGLKIDEIPF